MKNTTRDKFRLFEATKEAGVCYSLGSMWLLNIGQVRRILLRVS